MVPIFLSVSYSIMKFRFMIHQLKYVNLEPLMHTKAVSFAWQTQLPKPGLGTHNVLNEQFSEWWKMSRMNLLLVSLLPFQSK